MTERPPPTHVTFSHGTWAVLGLFGLVFLTLLVFQLILLQDQRTTTDDQLRTAVRQANAALPLIEDAQPLVEQVRGATPAIRQLGRDGRELLRELTPLAQELRTARADEQLQVAGALARRLIAADLPGAARALVRADLPRLTSRLGLVSDELLTQQRLRRLLVRSTAVLGEVRARHLVATSSRAAETVPEIEALLRESLAVQRETLEAGRRTLQAAERAARSAESIDRKTGPSLAPASGG